MDSKQISSTNCNGRVSKGVVDLPLEILSDILTRLPIESILTCRIVCKSWYEVTQDPDFVTLQLSRSNSRLILEPLSRREANHTVDHLLLLDIEEHKIKQIPIERMQLKGLRVTCSCNGLLCIASSNNKPDPVFIYNPMTRKRMILPSSASKLALSTHEVCLGFDPLTGKYKVVRQYKVNGVMRFEITSPGDSSWRELSAPHSILHSRAWGWVFWNGALYWKMIQRVDPGYYCFSVLAFDLSDERFQVISSPSNFSPRRYFELLDLDGCLTLVEHDLNLMKVWRVTGNKIGDLSFCLEQTYDTHVKWNDKFSYAVISRLNHNAYLLEVRVWNDQCQKEHLTQFFPQTAQYFHLDIPNVPDRFRTICFKPSLVSPVAASLPS